jgi:hypothetical protein
MEDAEVIANLWYIVDKGTGLIYRLAGRAYVASGSEKNKIDLLKALSKTDYLAARVFSVPKRFSVSNGSQTMEGYCSPSVLNDFLFELFEEVLEHLDATMPIQAFFEHDAAKTFKMSLPESPLFVATTLIEEESGIIRPQV